MSASPRVWYRTGFVRMAASLLVCLPCAADTLAQTKTMDARADDWCYGQASVGRLENSSATLTCGACQGMTNEACFFSSDCPGGALCVGSAYTEIVWWDDRTDAAVNDLAVYAVAQDADGLYLILDLWVDPDPVSLPFVQVAFDTRPGGGNELWDPGSVVPPTPPDQLKAPGNCNVSTDRGCTRDADCHFCIDSYEPPVCCEFGTCPPEDLCRVRTCGSGCDPGDACDMSETCENLGTTPTNDLGVFSSPLQQADYLFIYDFSIWLASAGSMPSVELKEWDGSGWAAIPSSCSSTQLPCSSDADCPPVGENPQACVTRFFPVVDPGGTGEQSTSPELAVPWSAFGCTGCPDACSCPDFGPGQEFTFTAVISRGEFFLDFVPRGEVEDVMSESVATTTSTTTNSCPGAGLDTTLCEIADAGSDAFVPGPCPAGAGDVPDGHMVPGPPLVVESLPGGDYQVSWSPSCSSCDTDYAVYVRDLEDGPGGVWQPWLCSTGGSTTAIFDPDGMPLRAGFAAVALNTGGAFPVEGGLGFASGGSRRTPGVLPCATSSISSCDGVHARGRSH